MHLLIFKYHWDNTLVICNSINLQLGLEQVTGVCPMSPSAIFPSCS